MRRFSAYIDRLPLRWHVAFVAAVTAMTLVSINLAEDGSVGATIGYALAGAVGASIGAILSFRRAARRRQLR